MIAESTSFSPRGQGGARHDATALIADAAPILRRSLVARNGLADGCDAAGEAIAWAWEHQNQLVTMENPIGYLYRVGQSSLRAKHRSDQLRVDLLPDRPAPDHQGHADSVDRDLFDGLCQLTPDQRVAVVMVHMYQFTYREVASLLECTEAAVTNYVHRGLERLRRLLGYAGER